MVSLIKKGAIKVRISQFFSYKQRLIMKFFHAGLHVHKTYGVGDGEVQRRLTLRIAKQTNCPCPQPPITTRHERINKSSTTSSHS